MALVKLFGEKIIKNKKEAKTIDLSTNENACLGIYFSAHWCPPCRSFTSKLVKLYEQLNAADKDFEVIFVSSDESQEKFEEYHNEMPWPALPYESDDIKDILSGKYEIGGIPSLVLVNPSNGEIITLEGRSVVTEYGQFGYPYTEERLKVAKAEKIAALEGKFNEILNLKEMTFVIGVTGGKKSVNAEEIVDSCDNTVLMLTGGDDFSILSELVKCQKKLGNEKLRVLLITTKPLQEMWKKSFPRYWHPEEGEGNFELVENFKDCFDDSEPPFCLVFKKDGSRLKIVSIGCERGIYTHGACAFPWSDEAINNLKQEKEMKKNAIRQQLKDFEFLAPSDDCKIIDKEGNDVELSTLQANEVVGLYFSAHWCGPCRFFTPELVNVYEQCIEQGKKFEVVFISADHSQEAFDNYFKEMPWVALSFENTEIKTALGEVFKIEGYPSLILFRSNGEIITDKGREAVAHGVEYFPWTDDLTEKAEAEKKERLLLLETTMVKEQEGAGLIVIGRHRGEFGDVRVSATHEVEFKSYSTASSPKAVVKKGQKARYEVKFVNGFGISQIGWANSEFELRNSYTGDGVGDDNNGYGFDGQRVCKWFDGDRPWGIEILPSSGQTLGVALDLEKGEVLYGVDGDWGEPMGVAFTDVNVEREYFPAFTAQNMTVAVNYGSEDFAFNGPDESFKSLVGEQSWE